MQEEKLLTPQEAADRLGIAVFTVEHYLRHGVLAGVKIGRLWRVRPRDLDTFIRSRTREAKPSPDSRPQ